MKQGIHRNPKTVLRVIRTYGLLSEVRRCKYRQIGEHLHKYSNLLECQFTAQRPNQKWVTDISCIHTRQGVLYLSMICELYDNSIISCKTGAKQTDSSVLELIHLVGKKEKDAGELRLHSD